MPGEATQRIVLCGPYAAAGAHDPHPVTTVEGQAWCPGNPPQHPDGSPVTGGDIRAQQEVALAGELRELGAERERLAAEAIAAGAAGLAAESYAVTVNGIVCRVHRMTSGRAPLRRDLSGEWWEATIDRSAAVELPVPEENGRPTTQTVWTTGRFPFTSGDAGSEQDALERAGRYCEMVAQAILRMRTEQERTLDGMVQAVANAVTVNRGEPVKM